MNNQLGFDAFDHRVGYHFQQSFAPGTVTKEQAMQITQEWIEDISNGQYDYVMALHTDKYYEGLPHYHVHIIVNPKNKVTGKNWDIYYKRDVNKFKDSSDRICASHGLDIIENYKNVSKSYYEWMIFYFKLVFFVKLVHIMHGCALETEEVWNGSTRTF